MSRYGLTYPLRLSAATLLAVSVALGLGLDRWYWTPVCAVATIWGSDSRLTWHRAAQRAVATVAGCVVGVGLAGIEAPFAVMACAVSALLLSAELLFPRNYGFAMVPISAMIVLIIDTSSPVPVNDLALAVDRVTAATLGSLIGLVAVLVRWPTSATHHVRRRLDESSALHHSIRSALNAPTDQASSGTLHRRLIDDLLGLESVAQAALGESRKRSAAAHSYRSTRGPVDAGYLLAAQLRRPRAHAVGTPTQQVGASAPPSHAIADHLPANETHSG